MCLLMTSAFVVSLSYLWSVGHKCKMSVGSFAGLDFSICKKCCVCLHDTYLRRKLKQQPAVFKQL